MAVVAMGLAAAVRLAGQLVGGGTAWPFVIGIGAVLVILVAIYAGLNASARALVRRVAAQRPTATVALVVPATSMAATAARLGVDPGLIRADGSRYAAVAILPDRVELWAGKGQEPHWWVPRTRDGVTVEHTQIGGVTTDALCIAAGDEDEEIVVRAVPVPVWLDVLRARRQAAMEQLVRDLGQDPARILGNAS
ncbi:hypothetical protein ACFT2C_28275 [Promicromonospora sp. NPDC057138]|uniref:hypothetical protein n=1 Tax=Promicromonospora sp. NPDC057138 TaxID=3346031 RepID=UPI00362CDCB1